MTPLLKFAFVGALATIGAVGVGVVRTSSTPPRTSAPAATRASSSTAATGTPSPVRPKAAPARQVTGVEPAEATPDVVLTDIARRLRFDEQTPTRLAQCFRGIDVGSTEGRVDLDLGLHDRGLGPTRVDTVTLVAGNRFVPELEHPAVERCALEALHAASVERLGASDGTTERVTLLLVDHKLAEMEMPAVPTKVAEQVDLLAGLPSRGPADAPVTLVEYSDFPCVFCASAAFTVEKLLQRYPTQLRVVFRQLPLPVHPESVLAAKAALAAHAMGKFWPMHDLLFANQTQLDRETLIGFAKQLGLERARFLQALDSPEIAAKVDRDVEAAGRLAARATPMFTVNGKVIVGAVPIDVLAQAIDEALAP